MNRPRTALSLALALAMLGLVFFLLWRGAPLEPELTPEQLSFRKNISTTAPRPDWSELEAYQDTITRETFIDQLTRVYSEGEAWRSEVELGGRYAEIHAGGDTRWRLNFASGSAATPPARYWRSANELPPSNDLTERPLEGIHIAIDPGHIGGDWAVMEERWYQINDQGTEVKEGELTLATAKILKPKLEQFGAKVSLVRDKLEPVTNLRPDDFEALAIEVLKSRGEKLESSALRKEKEILFYRKHEIRRRAHVINTKLQPDLVVCVHYNASSWGDPDNPQLTTRNDFHLLINGTYSSGEFRLEDNRFHLFKRLLQRTHDEELPLNVSVADAMAQATGLPAYIYTTSNAKRVIDNDYIWARNLLANRVYHCPIVFLEPYIMNSREVYERIGAGDYEGERVVAGKLRKSLFREYADGVAEGLRRYYSEARRTSKPR